MFFLQIFYNLELYFIECVQMTLEDIPKILCPETDLERRILTMPEILQGLIWGEPRYGHPEGKVVFHVREIYFNIDNLTPAPTSEDRIKLRTIALLHDTFKFREDRSTPRDYTKYHAVLARQFAEANIPEITDQNMLTVIEQHDEAYYCWRLHTSLNNQALSDTRLNVLLDKVKGYAPLYFSFFLCDTSTGDKTQAPLKWFRKTVTDTPEIFIKGHERPINLA